jgi:hypothetical protein
MRIILPILATFVSDRGYSTPLPCARVASLLGSSSKTLEAYPDCEPYFSGRDAGKSVVVFASLAGNEANMIAAFNITFGPTVWLAMVIHGLVVEAYVRRPCTISGPVTNIVRFNDRPQKA